MPTAQLTTWNTLRTGIGSLIQIGQVTLERGRLLHCQSTGPNPLHHRNGFGRPALRHGSSNCLFQVALYLPPQHLTASLAACKKMALELDPILQIGHVTPGLPGET